MNLPESGWRGYGAPGFRCHAIADQLRRAAILSDNAGHALREIAYLRWLAANPQIPDEVSLSIETAILEYRSNAG